MTQRVEQEDIRDEPLPNPLTSIVDNFDEHGAPLYDASMFEQFGAGDESGDVSGYDELEQPDEQPASYSEIDQWFQAQDEATRQAYVNSLSPDDVKTLQEMEARERVDQALEPVAAFHEARQARQQEQVAAEWAAAEQQFGAAERLAEQMIGAALREHGTRAVDAQEVRELADEIALDLAEQGYEMTPATADFAIREAAVRLGARAVVRSVMGRPRR